jgi:hypothetical protein
MLVASAGTLPRSGNTSRSAGTLAGRKCFTGRTAVLAAVRANTGRLSRPVRSTQWTPSYRESSAF